MAEQKSKLFTTGTVIASIICSAIVWVFFTIVLRSFVPDQSPTATWILSGISALSLTGVFFLAFHCLAVIIRDPVRRGGARY